MGRHLPARRETQKTPAKREFTPQDPPPTHAAEPSFRPLRFPSSYLLLFGWHGFGAELTSFACSSLSWGRRGRQRCPLRRQGAGDELGGSDTFSERSARRRRRRRQRAAAMAERSLPAQLLSCGGTHGLVTFDIFYKIF